MSNIMTQNITSIERTVLKPKIRELMIRGEEDPQVSFDVVVGGMNPKDAALGHLCLLGHVTSKSDEDTNYLTSLLGSLARREFYSRESLKDLDPRAAFERTVKKLNEVLENFFASDNLSLHIGVIAISNGQLMTSRIGKFKIGLVRDGEYIDVINNVDLFKKDDSPTLQFSNIISGPLEAGDKIFGYIPLKSITSREKTLRPVFLEQDQGQFVAKIEQIANENKKFSCCGVHIELAAHKEIPIPQSTTRTTTPDTTIQDALDAQMNPRHEPVVIRSTSYYSPTQDQAAGTSNPKDPADQHVNFPSVISHELSYQPNKAAVSMIAKLILNIKNIIPIKGVPLKVVIPVIITITLASAYFLIPNEESEALALATEQYQQASSLATNGDNRGAIALIEATLSKISTFNGEKTENLRAQIQTLGTSIKKIDGRTPELFRDLSIPLNGDSIEHFSLLGEKIAIVTQSSSVQISDGESLKEIGNLKHKPISWISTGNKIITLEGKNIRVIEPGAKLAITSSEELQSEILMPVIFGGNLYGVTEQGISKISDAANGGKTLSTWSKEGLSSMPTSLAIDGSLYALTSDQSRINVYFKGKKKADITVPIAVDPTSRIATTEDGPHIYLINPVEKIIYYLDKNTGSLDHSSSFANIPNPKSYEVGPDGSIYILDSSNKIFKL